MKSRRRRTNADDCEIDRESEEEEILPQPPCNPDPVNKLRNGVHPKQNPSSSKSAVDINKKEGGKQLIVPRSGKFFLHDDRKRNNSSKGAFYSSSSGHNESTDVEWKHDKFEEIVADEMKSSDNQHNQKRQQTNKKPPRDLARPHAPPTITNDLTKPDKKTNKPRHTHDTTSRKEAKIPDTTEQVDNFRKDSPTQQDTSDTKTKLNPSAKEFQPQTYSLYESSTRYDFSQSLTPNNFGWLPPPSQYFSMSVPPPPIVYNSIGQQRHEMKRKPVVSDRPVGVNLQVD